MESVTWTVPVSCPVTSSFPSGLNLTTRTGALAGPTSTSGCTR